MDAGGGGDALAHLSLDDVLLIVTTRAKVMGASKAQVENYANKLQAINDVILQANCALKENGKKLKTDIKTLQARCEDLQARYDTLAAESVVLTEGDLQEAEVKKVSPELYKLGVIIKSTIDRFQVRFMEELNASDEKPDGETAHDHAVDRLEWVERVRDHIFTPTQNYFYDNLSEFPQPAPHGARRGLASSSRQGEERADGSRGGCEEGEGEASVTGRTR